MHQRNQVRLHIPCCNYDQVASQAKAKLAEFDAALPPKPPVLPRQKVLWKPRPEPSIFKINFDRAVFTNEKKSGIGVGIRDYQGQVIASLAQQLPHALLPIEVEVLAAAHALEFGWEIGIGEAVLEGDSELNISALKEDGHSIVLVDPLIQDALAWSDMYSKLLYSHCRKEGNKLAHSLARHSINVLDYGVYIENVSPPLFSVLFSIF